MTLRTVMFGIATLAPGAIAPGAPVYAAATSDDAVLFETLGIVSSTGGINLAPPALVAIRDSHDVEWARELLAAGHHPAFADDVLATIDELAADQVVLIGVIDTSCTPATVVALTRGLDGELTMSAPGHTPEPIECLIAVVTVAVLAVDAADAPPGSGDHASLVAFGMTGPDASHERTAIEITDDDRLVLDILPKGTELPDLPPRDADHRRFAFVRSGCQHTTAELIVTPRVIDAHLEHDQHGVVINCAQAEFFLAVFDVPAHAVSSTAELDGG